MNDPILEVPASTLQQILNYLSTKPYNEVVTLIEMLRTTAKEKNQEETK